jgi:hypothetical protein
VEGGNNFRNVARGLSSSNIPRITGVFNDKVIKDAYKRVKLGEYWRVEEDESESVTVRGGVVIFCKRFIA